MLNEFESPDYLLVQLKPEEITNIVNAFTDSGNLAQSGLFLGGTKFLVIQGEQGVVIRGKKVCVYNELPVNLLLSISRYL